ncbi:hypothetical protein KFZ56_02265 [Virgibacillus sp. NKC19-3]|uniref:hypothetical protein n=1 Tax=Virgibacillus saliphilus TaxID=2831674 RepID=UPI001C9AC90A|nr:hypothetical protein [Virgibacillus sp. NKC19-3]MBY7141929.1 hypothetical protein [Virgibacillus sp. NKC19-3]
MKKILGAFVILIILGSVSFMFLSQELKDFINPFIAEEPVYVQIDHVPDDTQDRYDYTLTGLTAKGDEKTFFSWG